MDAIPKKTYFKKGEKTSQPMFQNREKINFLENGKPIFV